MLNLEGKGIEYPENQYSACYLIHADSLLGFYPEVGDDMFPETSIDLQLTILRYIQGDRTCDILRIPTNHVFPKGRERERSATKEKEGYIRLTRRSEQVVMMMMMMMMTTIYLKARNSVTA
jgi:hypothetical protein